MYASSKSRLNSAVSADKSDLSILHTDMNRVNQQMDQLNERMDNLMDNMEPVMDYLKQHVLTHKVSKWWSAMMDKACEW